LKTGPVNVNELAESSPAEVHRETGIAIPLLRAEGVAVLLLATALYAQHGIGWLLFVALFFVPDVAMLGYLRDARTGALLYNLAHNYAVPLLLAAGGLLTQRPVLVGVALIWVAHIGLDRMLGYGLKYPTAFQDTHLGRIGRARGAS
jgi:hypothetical protein